MIFISVGHHEDAPGASYNGFNEFDEARRWAAILMTKLGDSAVKVPEGVLKEKVKFINQRDPVGSVAVEIHFNSAVNAEGEHIGRGCETLYYPGSTKGKELATAVNAALATVFEPDRGVKEGWYRMNPDNGPDYFLARTRCPAIIIEPDFIHRQEIIQTNRDTACNRMADVLLEYVSG